VDHFSYLSLAEHLTTLNSSNVGTTLKFRLNASCHLPFEIEIDLLKYINHDYMELSPVFSGVEEGFTIATWANVHQLSSGANQTIFGEFSSSGNARNLLMIRPDGSLMLDIDPQQVGMAVSKIGLVQEGQWIHLAVVKTIDSVIFYKNGKKFGDVVLYNEEHESTTPNIALIGTQFDGINYYNNMLNGSIDDFRTFNVSLALDEVNVLYMSGVGTTQDIQTANYDGIHAHDAKIFALSTNLYVNISSPYSNIHNFPYYHTRPQISFVGTTLGNIYNYELIPNTNLSNVANISMQATRTISGQQVLKVGSVPAGLFEITKIYVDLYEDGSYNVTISPEDLFYYYGIDDDERTLFIQYDENFIEQDTYQVRIEYTYTTSEISGFSYYLPLDVVNFVSDIYDVTITANTIHNTKIIRTFSSMNIDHSGPLIDPLFEENAWFGSESGIASFKITDPNDVSNAYLQVEDDNEWRNSTATLTIANDIWDWEFNETHCDRHFRLPINFIKKYCF